jgi:hypothetical protein
MPIEEEMSTKREILQMLVEALRKGILSPEISIERGHIYHADNQILEEDEDEIPGLFSIGTDRDAFYRPLLNLDISAEYIYSWIEEKKNKIRAEIGNEIGNALLSSLKEDRSFPSC